jgi:heterodisulfide reductase subunit D
VEDCDDAPDSGFCRETADVVYFTGCVAAFFPVAQQIPVALAAIFQAADVDFTLLGSKEWCCGFPLLGAGLSDQASEFITHNLEAVARKGASKVVLACPSCYQMWLEHYDYPEHLEIYHSTQFLHQLISAKQLKFKEVPLTVTYHDPCDLGRGAREFDAPRSVIQAIPGVELVETEHYRENCRCCGGGGNLEMIDGELSSKITESKIKEIVATGAQAVVTSCQQCVRTLTTWVRRNELSLQVLDITKLVNKALEE